MHFIQFWFSNKLTSFFLITKLQYKHFSLWLIFLKFDFWSILLLWGKSTYSTTSMLIDILQNTVIGSNFFSYFFKDKIQSLMTFINDQNDTLVLHVF